MSFFFSKKRALSLQHAIGALLFLTVFLLPLHFHSLTLAAQVNKECSCYQGGRTQAGLAPDPVDLTPSLQPFVLSVYETRVFSWLSIDLHTIRAPPSIASL